LADPAWVLHEAAKIGVKSIAWPKQYYAGKVQYETAIERAAAASGGVK
jgi:anthraniloyl-CoA monooxygenase